MVDIFYDLIKLIKVLLIITAQWKRGPRRGLPQSELGAPIQNLLNLLGSPRLSDIIVIHVIKSVPLCPASGVI